MVNQTDPGVEQTLSIHDELPFVEKQDVPAGSSRTRDNWAYRIKTPEDMVLFIVAGTQFAPEFRDPTGAQLPDDTRVTIQKCNKQGDPLSEFVLSEHLGRFVYDKMRKDPDFFRETQRELMLDEREIAKVFVEIPEGGPDFSASQSRMTIGDDTTDFGTPAEILEHDDLSPEESAAIKAASQRSE